MVNHKQVWKTEGLAFTEERKKLGRAFNGFLLSECGCSSLAGLLLGKENYSFLLLENIKK